MPKKPGKVTRMYNAFLESHLDKKKERINNQEGNRLIREIQQQQSANRWKKQFETNFGKGSWQGTRRSKKKQTKEKKGSKRRVQFKNKNDYHFPIPRKYTRNVPHLYNAFLENHLDRKRRSRPMLLKLMKHNSSNSDSNSASSASFSSSNDGSPKNDKPSHVFNPLLERDPLQEQIERRSKGVSGKRLVLTDENIARRKRLTNLLKHTDRRPFATRRNKAFEMPESNVYKKVKQRTVNYERDLAQKNLANMHKFHTLKDSDAMHKRDEARKDLSNMHKFHTLKERAVKYERNEE